MQWYEEKAPSPTNDQMRQAEKEDCFVGKYYLEILS